MATLADLQNAVSGLLNLPAIPAVLQLNSATREHAFEAYVLSCLAQAVRQAGGTAVIHGRNTGPTPTAVIFRGGHGRLGSNAQDFAYVVCTLGQKQFELHADVQYEGSSGAIHEVDVSIYDHASAVTIRQTPNAFASTRKLFGAIECKFYDSPLGTVLGRTFVGLVSDCGTLRFKAFATNGHDLGLAKYFGHGQNQRGTPFFGLSPIRPDVQQRFIDFFDQSFRQWAKVV